MANISVEERDNANYLLDSSITFAMTGKVDMAINAVKKALEIDPDFAQAYNKLGDYYIKKGKTKEAAEVYKKSLELDPDNENSHFDYGCTMAALGNYDLALEELSIALKKAPEHYEIYSRVASIFFKLGKYEEARDNALKAYEADKEDVYATYVLACAYQKLDKPKNAENLFFNIIDRYRNLTNKKQRFAEGHYYMGKSYFFMGNINLAVENLKKAVEYDTEDVDYHFSFGMMYSDADAFSALAEAYAAAGMTEDAKETIEKAIALEPENAYYQEVKKSIA